MKPASDETNSGPLELIPDLGVLGADHHHLGMYKPHDLELPRAPFDRRSRKSEEKKGIPGVRRISQAAAKFLFGHLLPGDMQAMLSTDRFK